MGFYDEIGVRPFINAGGWMYTRYGGSIMPEPVVAAMAEASKHFVNLYDLQDRVGQAIAAMTHNESAFVSCGAASGILLAVAACIAGTDSELADRLPDTQGMRNEIIIGRCARGTEANPAIRAAGGKIVEAGNKDSPLTADQAREAITDQTAAIVLIAFESERELNAAPIVRVARERNVRVLVDGAYATPPKENLWHYTRDLGVDAFITSGGKAVRGPQSTGLVLGSPAIIEGCKFHASPNLCLGRGMKVGKEEFAGVYTALKQFLATDFKAQARRDHEKLIAIQAALSDIPEIAITAAGPSELQIRFDPKPFKISAEAMAKELQNSDPSILLRGRGNQLTLRTTQLQEGEERIVAETLRKFFTARLRA